MTSFDPTIIIVGSLIVFFAFFFVVRLVTKGVFSGMAKKKQADADRLMATGGKARATVTGVKPTGVIVNHINIQCVMTFRMEPLGGAPAFDAEKKSLVNQAQMPRVGDQWPAFYNLADPTDFVTVPPFAGTQQEITLYGEFGIPHPLGDLR